MKHVLIVDDEPDIRSSLESILRDEDYLVTTSGSAVEALELVRDAEYDALLLDIWLPDGDGLDVLDSIRALDLARPPEVIMISGHGTIESAVRATKLGAYDFLEKPLSLERTLLMLRNAVESRRLRHDNSELQKQMAQQAYVTGESVPVKALRQQIRLMAPTNGRVLIYGESGTGKERIARTIHSESLRKDRVFVELNCAAIPEDFIEGELFGYRRGAHGNGGAHSNGITDKLGTFERADGGTLFLDEVGDMSLKTQAKVLRALDEQRFTPVGAHHPVHVDVRVIAATNKDLEDEIASGNFREDLFYRLNVIPFFVPPLRDRMEDIPLLVQEFLQEFGREYGRPRVEISADGLAVLNGYRWPGNVRELRNVLERVLILNPKAQRIERKHLPVLVYREPRGESPTRPEATGTLIEAREAYERDYILKKLDDCRGNVSRAAEALGLERSHLYRKMRSLGVPVREA